MRTDAATTRVIRTISSAWTCGALVGVAIFTSAGSATAAQPVFLTPAAQGTVGGVLYELPYATSGRPQDGFGQPVTSETVVTIGNPRAVGAGNCRVQVEWLEWDASPAGVSGPFTLTPDRTLEFTTALAPGFPTPYQLNVFRNSEKPFEGHAKIRSNCTTPLRIDAEVVQVRADQTGYVIDPIEVVKPSGNVGD